MSIPIRRWYIVNGRAISCLDIVYSHDQSTIVSSPDESSEGAGWAWLGEEWFGGGATLFPSYSLSLYSSVFIHVIDVLCRGVASTTTGDGLVVGSYINKYIITPQRTRQ